MIAEAVAPTYTRGESQVRLARTFGYYRIALAIVALPVSGLLPNVTAKQRTLFIALVFVVWLPWTLGVQLLARRSHAGWPQAASMVGDIAVFGVFQVLIPPVSYSVQLGYMLVVAYYTYLGGWIAGAISGGLAIAVTALVTPLIPVSYRVDAFTVAMFPVILASLAQIHR